MAEAPGSPAVDYDAAQDVALTVLCHLAARRSDFLHHSFAKAMQSGERPFGE